MIILLDTNFLMLPHEHRIDIFSEIERIVLEAHEIVVPSGVIEELGKIARGSGKDSVSANVAIKLIELNNLRVIKSDGNVDDFVKRYVDEHKGIIVCTNDKALKRAIKNKTTVICMRGKDHLVRI